MAFVRRAKRWAPTLVVAVVASVIAAFAVQATGNEVQRPDLNNAGIWASSDADALYGRFNKSASTTEFALAPGKVVSPSTVDVLQDGNTVVARDLAKGSLIAVDSLLAANDLEKQLGVDASALVDLRGGTLAVMEPGSGKVWGIRTNQTQGPLDLSGLDPSGKPLAELDSAPGGMDPLAAASLSVGVDGSIHAASASGKSLLVKTSGAGFEAPVYGSVGGGGLKSVQVAALGSDTAILDAAGGVIHLPGGKAEQLDGVDADARIQQAGANLGTVLVATSSRLLEVGFDGVAKTLLETASGKAAAPVALGNCRFAAWAATRGVVAWSCDDQAVEPREVDSKEGLGASLVDPVFRVNWNRLILNDRETGRIYDLDERASLEDWKAVDPKQKAESDKDAETKTTKSQDQRPRAEKDTYGARPDRTSVLHVLDNDIDPNGKVLSIVDVGKVSGGATAVASPDGQTILFHQPQDGKNASFRYTIRNEIHTASAEVTIEARETGDNEAPKLRHRAQDLTYSVGSAGIVTMPVVADWRDFDGDPITVVSATQGGDAIPVTSDGQIDYTAEKAKVSLTRTVAFQVSDGIDDAGGTVKVKVLGAQDTDGIAPVAQADAVRGEVGKAVSVLPLANDLPGVDPANPQTAMTLAADVKAVPGLKTPLTDRDGGRVTLTGTKEGVYFLDYSIGFGSAPTAKAGTIRVDIKKDLGDDPVAMPDNAVVRGQAPILVDVLANDYDPAGGLLTVQTATAADPEALEVAVVKGRWLRIRSLQPELADNPAAVTYQITNGLSGKVDGSVTVSQLASVTADTPLMRDDFADVRAGDSTLIPVLANDTTQGGSTLSLVTNILKRPGAGSFEVVDAAKAADAAQGDVGTAYVSGNQVRYVAPGTVTEELSTEITYMAQTPSGEQNRATVFVTVHPQPSEADRNAPPEPPSIETRAVSGDTVTIPIPSSGQDPDGDSVSLLSLASGPQRGRILGFTPEGITYQAFPTDDANGTDTFRYLVADKFGATGTGIIRVAVVPPGQTQPPVAVDDQVTARPGAQVSVDALANDFIATSDKVVVRPLRNPPAGATLLGEQGPLSITVPADKAESIRVPYVLKGNADLTTTGVISVTGKAGYINPPRVRDEVATTSDGKTAVADVLAHAWDPDSDKSALTVTVPDSSATVAGGVVTVPVTTQVQVISYQVADPDGGVAAGLIYVPAVGGGVPFAQGMITLEQGKKTTISLAEFVTSPRGRPVRITVDTSMSATPSDHLTVTTAGRALTDFTLEPDAEYVGPASVTMTVIDDESLEGDGVTAVVSIPIQVGPVTPVLRCPQEPQTIRIGQVGKDMDLASLCHVWTANPADAATLTFTADWKTRIDLVRHTLSADGRSLTLEADGGAPPNANGLLTIGVAGSTVTQELPVLVKNARRPRLGEITAEVKQGETITRTMPALDSPLETGRQDTIVSLVAKNGAAKSQSSSSVSPPTTWSVTPSATFAGTLEYTLTVSDVSDPTNLGRQIQVNLTVSVYGKPDAPGAPRPGKVAQNHAETLTWTKPNDNGARIEKYVIANDVDATTWESQTPNVTAKPLKNAQPYHFTVQACNKAGCSEFGPNSITVTPDQAPSQVQGFKASSPMDKKITLSWQPVSGTDFTPVTSYLIKWPSGSKVAQAGESSVPVDVDANVETTFTIWARNHNDEWKSKKAATTKGWPSGPPGDFTISNFSADNLNTDKTALTITWSAADANGEGPVTYSVTDSVGGAIGGCQSITATRCSDGGIVLDGEKHTYTVVAMNKPEQYQTSTSGSWNAEGTPPKLGVPVVKATGKDRQVDVSGTSLDSRGPSGSSVVEILASGSVKDTESVDSRGGDSYSATVDAADNGSQANITARLCYTKATGGRECGPESGVNNDAVPFGDLATPGITAWRDGQTARFRATGNGNGRGARLVVTSSNGNNRYDSQVGSGALTLEAGLALSPGASTSFTAHLETASTDPSRSNSGSQPSSTVTIPNPTATFETDGAIGSISTTHPTWFAVKLTLRDWPANSTVHCSVGSTVSGLADWSGNFGVDGNGNWGTARLTTSNSSGYLMVQTAAFLPDKSNCS